MNKTIDLGLLYPKLYDIYSAVNSYKNKQKIKDEVNTLWRSLKSSENVI